MRTMGLALASCLMLLVAAGAARGQSVDQTVPEGQLTLELIKHHFEQEAYAAEIDDDGDLKITDDRKFIAFIRLDAERKVITLFALYPLKSKATELAKLQLVNRLNDQVLLVRFCMPRPTGLWCDYQFSYEGGISPKEILTIYRLFARITPLAVAKHDKDDVVGED